MPSGTSTSVVKSMRFDEDEWAFLGQRRKAMQLRSVTGLVRVCLRVAFPAQTTRNEWSLHRVFSCVIHNLHLCTFGAVGPCMCAGPQSHCLEAWSRRKVTSVAPLFPGPQKTVRQGRNRRGYQTVSIARNLGTKTHRNMAQV